MDLTLILDYEMSQDEALALKICYVWLKLAREIFPNYHHTALPKRRDPRKSLLFKYSYKLCREIKGIIDEDDLPLYVRSQLDVMKALAQDNEPLRVEINCLCGDKAWKRWKLWHRHYVKKMKAGNNELTTNSPAAILRDLENAKIHLESRFNGVPSEQEYEVRKNDVTRWIGVGRISPYYAALSPWAKKYVNFKELSLDLGVFQKDVTPEIEAQFKVLFPYEGRHNL